MNNIKQKNIIMGLNGTDNIPYSIHDVRHSNNKSIDAITMNNSFNQLVDNDLYIEKYLTNLSSYQYGPKTYDSTVSQTQDDGTKYWTGMGLDEQPQILHKINKPLSTTISNDTYTDNSKIQTTANYVAQYSNILFSGIGSSSSNGKIIYRRVTDQKWSVYKNEQSYTYFLNGGLFIIGSNKDILLKTGDDDSFSFLKINSEEFDGYPTAINIDSNNNIYVGTNNGKIYYGKMPDNKDVLETTKIQFILTQTAGIGRVNDIDFREYDKLIDDSNYILVTGQNGLYESGYAKELLNRRDTDVEATNIIDTIEIWDKNYIVSKDGIYLVNNNGTQEKKYTNSNLEAVTVYTENIYVVKQENKNINILSISDTFTHTSFLNFSVDDDELCQKIKLFETDEEKIVLIGTNKHLRCIVKSKTDSTIINDKIEFDDTNIVNVSLLEIQNIEELFRVFVTVSKDSSKNFYIYNIYQQDGKYLHLEETANFGGVIKDRDIDNTNNNHFYNFANRHVYVDGRYLKSLDGVINIDLKNTNVTILNRTERKYFSDAGLIVKIGNEIKFINESLRVINKIIIPSDITISNIEGIVTGLDNVYILENNKIHICSVTSTNKYKVNEEYTFNKLGVFNSSSNVINGGFVINDDFVILSSNTLVEMNTNIVDKQSKMIFNILSDASSGETTQLIPKLIAKNPSMYNSYPVVNGNNIEILTYNGYPQVFNKEQVFPFTNVQNIVNFNEYVIVNYNNKLSALKYNTEASSFNGYTINGIDGSVNSLMNIGNTIIYGNGTNNMFATSKLSNMSDEIYGFANINFGYDFDIYRMDDEDKIFDFIGLSSNKVVLINKDNDENTTTIETLYTFGSDESQREYKTLIDEGNDFISLSSKVSYTSTWISTGLSTWISTELSTDSETGSTTTISSIITDTISSTIIEDEISSRYKTFVKQHYTNNKKQLGDIYFNVMYPTYTDNTLMKTPDNDVYILRGDGYNEYTDSENDDGKMHIANNLYVHKLYDGDNVNNIINIDTYKKSRTLNKTSLNIESDVDVFIFDKKADGNVEVLQKSLDVVEAKAIDLQSDINDLKQIEDFNPAQIIQINDNTTITIKPITGETILKVLVYNITESNIITFFVLCKDSSNEKTLYRCNSNSSNVIQITENNKILNGNYFIDIVKNQKTQQIYKVREISNEAILYPIDTVQQIPLSVNWDDINEVKLLKQKTVLIVPQMSSNIINVNTILLNVQESDMLQNYSNLQSGQIYYKDMFVNDGILYAIKNDGTLQYAKYWDLFAYGFQIYLTDVKIDGNKIIVSKAIPGSVIDNGHIIYVSKLGNNKELFQITYDKNNDSYSSINISTDVRNYLISLTNTPLQDIFESKTEFAMSDGNAMYHIYDSSYSLKTNPININNIVNFVQDDLNNTYILKTISGGNRQIYKLIKNDDDYSTTKEKDGLLSSAQLIHSNKQFGIIDGTDYIIGNNSFSKTTGSIDNICGFYVINENKFNAISNNKLFKSFTDVTPYIQYQKVIQSDLNISQMYLTDSNLIPSIVTNGTKKEFYDLDMNTYSFFINKYDGQTEFDYAILTKNGEKVIKFAYNSGGKLFYINDNGDLIKWFLDNTDEIRLAYGFYNDSNYTLITDDKKIITFTGYDEHIRKFVIKSSDVGDSKKLIKTGFNEFIFNTNNGVYYVKKDSVIKITYDYNIESLNEITLDGSIKYVYSIGNTVYLTNNYRKINDKQDVLLVLPELITSIYDVQKINNYAYEFATNRGLFSTIYDYELINDLTFYKSDDIYKIYKNLLSTEISGRIEQVISNHIELMHNPDSLITKINENIIDTNFENINESWFQNNDMIQQVIFGKQDDVGLSVFTENFITNDQPKINYIVKKYTSGVTEIYILVDTTNTYYINHLNGAGFSKPSTNSYQRLNLEKFGTQVSFLEYDENMINTYKTKLSVVLDESIYHINEGIIDCQINGCSLPRDIYMDIDGGFDNSTASISSMYQSVVVPSQVAKVDGNIIQFNCFGTDQQSIRITYR